MKVAVIYTGALRTIKKTMRYFKQNVLLNSDVHVFACVQNDTKQMASEMESWIKNEMGCHLKCIEWFSLASQSNWVQHRDFLLGNMNISNHIRDYLKNSGSIIEYYQLQLAYIKMSQFEHQHGFKYDYIIRARTDTLYAKPIDFHWLNWADSEVETRLQRIKSELIDSNIEPSNSNIINYFMNTIVSDTIIDHIYNIKCRTIQNRDTLPDITSFNNYIKNGSYILTMRKNLLYIIRRDLFYTLPSLGTFYGYQQYYNSEPGFWWNAESQFEAMCYNSNITIHDYSSEYDENSLYNYNEKRYFDLDYNILNPYMLYCLVRN
jgi:hypothetical protein